MDYSPQALPAVSNFANPYRFGKGELGLGGQTLPILAGLAKEN